MTDAQRAGEIARSISKTGGLALVGAETLAWARGLDAGGVLALYEHVRDESARLEAEWRDAFVVALGIDPALLPAPEDWRGQGPVRGSNVGPS